MTRRLAALAVGLSMLAFAPAFAQEPPAGAMPADALTDPALKRAEVLAFIGVKPGDRVADIVPGRFARALSQAVGPTGKVYAVQPAEIVKAHPTALTLLQAVAASPGYGNVVVTSPPIDAPALPAGLDAVFMRQDYHDLHDKFMGPADVGSFNRNVFAALKPGGVFVVLDHAAATGSGLRDTDTLHRIDAVAVKSEVMAAGFVLEAESPLFVNPGDDHTKNVFDPAVRGHTDQFLLRFRKPR